MNISKYYSTYTLFTASLYNTGFVVLNIPHNHKIQIKETEEETVKRWFDKEDIGPSSYSKGP